MTESNGDTERGMDLLERAAEALIDGEDPLAERFLMENNVTLSEVYELADNLALGARLLVQVRKDLDAGGIQGHVAAFRLVEATISAAKTQECSTEESTSTGGGA